MRFRQFVAIAAGSLLTCALAACAGTTESSTQRDAPAPATHTAPTTSTTTASATPEPVASPLIPDQATIQGFYDAMVAGDDATAGRYMDPSRIVKLRESCTAKNPEECMWITRLAERAFRPGGRVDSCELLGNYSNGQDLQLGSGAKIVNFYHDASNAGRFVCPINLAQGRGTLTTTSDPEHGYYYWLIVDLGTTSTDLTISLEETGS